MPHQGPWTQPAEGSSYTGTHSQARRHMHAHTLTPTQSHAGHKYELRQQVRKSVIAALFKRKEHGGQQNPSTSLPQPSSPAAPLVPCRWPCPGGNQLHPQSHPLHVSIPGRLGKIRVLLCLEGCSESRKAQEPAPGACPRPHCNPDPSQTLGLPSHHLPLLTHHQFLLPVSSPPHLSPPCLTTSGYLSCLCLVSLWHCGVPLSLRGPPALSLSAAHLDLLPGLKDRKSVV